MLAEELPLTPMLAEELPLTPVPLSQVPVTPVAPEAVLVLMACTAGSGPVCSTSSRAAGVATLIPTKPPAWMRIFSDSGDPVDALVLKMSGATLAGPRKFVPSVVTPVLPPSFQGVATGA